MKTVRAVVGMSSGVEAQPVAEYVGLIKEVGMALRELVGRVGSIKDCLPRSDHEEVRTLVHLLRYDWCHLSCTVYYYHLLSTHW